MRSGSDLIVSLRGVRGLGATRRALAYGSAYRCVVATRIVVHAVACMLLAASCLAEARTCDASTSGIEKTLCERPELAKLDDALNRAFSAAIARSDAPALLRADEREWLAKSRDTCDTYDCLQQTYAQQVEHWRTLPSRSTLERLYGGEYVRYVRGAPDTNQGSVTVKAAAGARLAVTGSAVWVGNIDGDVHDGEIDGVAVHRYTWAFVDRSGRCSFSMRFDADRLTVSNGAGSCGGLNVTFDGAYRKQQ